MDHGEGAEERARGEMERQRVVRAISRARSISGLDQAAFARRISVFRGKAKPYSRSTVAGWEDGSSNASAWDLLLAAHLAGVSICELLEPGELEIRVTQLRTRVERLERLSPENDRLWDELRTTRAEIAELQRQMLGVFRRLPQEE